MARISVLIQMTVSTMMVMLLMISLTITTTTVMAAGGGGRCDCSCYFITKKEYYDCMSRGGSMFRCADKFDANKRCGRNCRDDLCRDNVPGGF